MEGGETLLMSPPWTPHLDQSQFESISPLLLDSTRSIDSSFDFTTPENIFYPPQHTQSSLNRSSQPGHKRFLSFPLASLNIKQQPTSHSHSRTMSCITPHQGLGISFFDEPFTPTLVDQEASGSAPVSPFSDEYPTTPIKEEIEKQNDDLASFDTVKEEPGTEKMERPLTAAEIRAEKRKMKRFRLTHQQTRYLMSEFARQAHPDAAHREKLSRAIPGLSSRQVQVWFQNRRAKLKRVTQDDRENIVRSRALPDNFDLSTTLQSPFGLPSTTAIPPQTPTSGPSGSTSERVIRNLAPAAQIEQHRGLASPFENTPMSTTVVQLSPLDICRPFGNFLPTGFYPIAEDISSPFAPDAKSSPQTGQAPSHAASTSQTGGFTESPLSGNFHSGSPTMSPYGLGFSYGSLPGFQASAFHGLRNSGKHPGKVMIPRKTPTSYSNMPDTPMYTSTTCSPLGMPMGFPVLSAPASVTSFPNYIQ